MGKVALETFAVALPLQSPKQFSVPPEEVMTICNAAGILKLAVEVQPFASVTVTTPAPTHKFEGFAPLCPPDHEKVYGGVPPLPVAVAPPLQTSAQL